MHSYIHSPPPNHGHTIAEHYTRILGRDAGHKAGLMPGVTRRRQPLPSRRPSAEDDANGDRVPRSYVRELKCANYHGANSSWRTWRCDAIYNSP